MVICFSVIVTFFLCEQADARKKRKRFISPVKVEEVATSPDPFIIGQSPMTLSMIVKVPLSAIDDKILEVSALITSPTRRTMSFVSQRLPFAEATQGGQLSLVPVELVWDGKDQYGRLVADGSYFYEIQAKLMEDEGNGPRTKIVSHRVQGTLEALAYVGEVLPPLPPEPEVPAEIEALQQERLAADDLPMMETGVKVEDEVLVLPEEEFIRDGGQRDLEGSGENESGQELLNGNVEDLVPESPAEALQKESDSKDQTSITAVELSTMQSLTEPSSPSEENLSLH